MKWFPKGLAVISALLLLAACSSAPAPAPAPSPASELETVNLFCGDSAKAVALSTLGVPEGEQPIDVAVGAEHVWVLFKPTRLLRIPRAGGAVRAEMRLGKEGEVWSTMDVDPVDGSIWVSSTESFALKRVSPDWGNFGDLATAPDLP
jgi:streptogramin lyase